MKYPLAPSKKRLSCESLSFYHLSFHSALNSVFKFESVAKEDRLAPSKKKTLMRESFFITYLPIVHFDQVGIVMCRWMNLRRLKLPVEWQYHRIHRLLHRHLLQGSDDHRC